MLKPFFVWQNKELIRINPEEVICLSTDRNYTRIYLSNNSCYLVRSTLAGALKKLPGDMFIKVHRSYAVSILYIDTLAKDHLTIDGNSIPIGRQFYKSVIDKLNIIE